MFERLGAWSERRSVRPRRPYRVGAFSWLAAGLFAWGVVFGGVMVVDVLVGGGEDITVGDRIAFLFIAVPFFGAYLIFSYRLLRFGIYVREEGVVVKEFFGTTTYSWTEIRGVQVVPFMAKSRPLIVQAAYRLNPMVRGVDCVGLSLTSGREHIVDEVNSSVPTWLGTKPSEIAERIESSRPHQPELPG